MLDVREKPQMVDRAILIAVYQDQRLRAETATLLEELEDLVETLGIPVLDRHLMRVRDLHPGLLLSRGKLEELEELCQEHKADVVVFDHALTPPQQRNLEKHLKLTVIDRHEVILDIFAKRAQTKEAQLQVQLARMEYSLPRLTRAWTHLGRQGGTSGPGAKGEGEQQIELDRRMVRKKIDQLKTELAQVRKNRSTQRKTRKRIPIPQAAIVGYTNAGKSSLLRRLTGADVLVADKLFATLDTTTRRITLPNGQPLLLTDTVGFVRNLPHGLVEAFKATLEEALLAEFLIHVVDASNPLGEQFLQTTLDVLKELGADEKQIITVFNKLDQVEDPGVLAGFRLHHPKACFLSAHTGEGTDTLLAACVDQIADRTETLHLRFPHHRGDLVALAHGKGCVHEEKYEDEYVALHATLPRRMHETFAPFIQDSVYG